MWELYGNRYGIVGWQRGNADEDNIGGESASE